jgi:hypothetical protein
MVATQSGKDVWDDQRIAILARMLKAGATFSEMALRINLKTGSQLTRNACIGKAGRLGLRGKTSRSQMREPVRAAKGNYSSDGAVAGGILSRIKSKLNNDRAPVVALKVVHETVEQEPLHIALMDLTDHTCHWPYGDGPFTFCGCPTLFPKPFCSAHTIRAVQKRLSEAERDRRQEHGKTIAAIGRKVSKSRRAFA